MAFNDLEPAFSAEDRVRLSQSSAWHTHPHFVESMCRLFHVIDPMGCWSGTNRHAMTEYLAEVEILAKRLPDIGTEQDLSAAMQSAFHEMFEGHTASCDWDDLAKAAWAMVLTCRN